MGRRIHKAIGYGMTGLASENCRLVDSRLSPDGYLTLDCETRDDRYSPSGYIQWLYSRLKTGDSPEVAGRSTFDIRTQINQLEDGFDLDACVVASLEFGLSNTFLIVPPQNLKAWTRYNDPIDYEVELQHPNAGVGRVDYVRYGIHPYDDQYWDRRTGRVLDSVAARFVMPVLPKQPNFDQLAQSIGFSNEEEARANIRPVTPPAVLILSEYLGLFKDTKTAQYLEPMVYTYWA